MIPQIQRTKTNCLQTCIACLLDMNAAYVPDFSLSLNWWQDMQEWLHERGLFFLEIRVAGTVKKSRRKEIPDPVEDEDLEGIPQWHAPEDMSVVTVWNPLTFPALAIFAGTTKAGIRHMVIGTCDGCNFIPQFDPATGSEGKDVLTVESVCFLVPRDPGTYAKFGRNMEKIETLSKSLIKGAKPNAINHEIHEIARESLGKPPLFLNGREPSKA